jgi:hypothetical protein
VGEQDYGQAKTLQLGWTQDGNVQLNMTGVECIAADRKTVSQLHFRCNKTAVSAPNIRIKSESFEECSVEIWVDTAVVCKKAPSPPPPPPPSPPPSPPPPPPPPKGFQCKDDKCVAVPSGGVPKTACEATCKKDTYKCRGDKCVVAAGGTSKADCESVCIVPRFECKANKCVPATTGGLPKSGCESECPKVERYECKNRQCSVAKVGGVSKPDCAKFCV